ncbi:hypothetical protein [Chitinophaga sp.]|uniref:hypothetical protein n=1 Tax=Chitinophaga sp. TaxID=1869181 RepID=UPI0031E14DFC
MKSISELENMLAMELSPFTTGERSVAQPSKYYNEPLGDISFILGGIVKAHLKEKHAEWFVNGKWIDDTLIETFTCNQQIIEMSGVVIWGLSGDTEQWTDPFRIVIEFSDEEIAKYTILFGDVLRASLKFTDFKYNRDYWKGSEMDWDYIIFKKVG